MGRSPNPAINGGQGKIRAIPVGLCFTLSADPETADPAIFFCSETGDA
jgi:hypothetical protein